MPKQSTPLKAPPKVPPKAPIQLPKYGPKHFDPAEHGGVKKRGPIFLFFGVILPTVAMLFETNLHFCARHFFDPFPSPAHVVLFGLIPFSNFLVWLGTRRDMSSHYAFMSLASGMAMGVACLYSLMFLPLTPISCFFTLALGFGLLGLAPLLSVPCNLISGRTVCHLASKKLTYFNAHQVEHIGHMIILVMVVAVELPSTLTRINLSRAADANPVIAADGVKWLRRFGSAEVLQRACYERSGRATDILGSLYESSHPLSIEQTRRIYYQVTGRPFNSVPIPKSARATIQHAGAVADPDGLNAGVEDEFDMDTDIAGEAVSGVARGLSVGQSKFEGKVNADAALANLDWSFDFINDSKFDREARAKILLPPDAVVTKATLTVNNVERDATIMVRSTARARYRQAVVEKKDPLLVSTCGKDQILVQCFPVKPGETMKVKLKIAAPLNVTAKGTGALVLPAFLERNFEVSAPNALTLHSSKPITAPGLTTVGAPGDYQLSGQIDAGQLAGFKTVVDVQRDQACHRIWCKAGSQLGNGKIERVVEKAHYDGIENLIFVVDGSASMQQFMPQIADGLKALPSTKKAHIQVVGDNLQLLTASLTAGGSPETNAAIDTLKNLKTEGGQDDFVALDDALRQATENGRSGVAVVWIHAAQPATVAHGSSVEEMLDRAQGAKKLLLFDMQLAAGPNEILSNLTPDSLVRVPRSGTVAEDLSQLISSCNAITDAGTLLSAGSAEPGEYKFVPPTPVDPKASTASNPPEGLEVDDSLAKIWANHQISEFSELPDANRTLEANQLASTFQIVSPVSSAIVVAPEPQAIPVPVLAKATVNLEEFDPMMAMRKLRSSVSAAGHSVASQLNALSSAASSSAVREDHELMGRPIETAFKSKEAEIATAPADPRYGQSNEIGKIVSSSPEPFSGVNTAGTARNYSAAPGPAESRPNAFDSLGGGMDAFSSLGDTSSVASEKKQEVPAQSLAGGITAEGTNAPQLQGATNGAVAESKSQDSPGSAWTSRQNYFLRYPVAKQAYDLGNANNKDIAADKETLSNASGLRGTAGEKGYFAKYPFADGKNLRLEGAPASVDPTAAADAPDAKPVPEADTWMLLAVVFGILGGATIVNQVKRRAKKA